MSIYRIGRLVEVIVPIIFILIFFINFIRIINRAKGVKEKAKEIHHINVNNLNQNYGYNKDEYTYVNSGHIKNASSSFKEDKNDDWLSKQMKEENQILRRGGMNDYGANHDKNCDADLIREEHFGNCSDGIVDSGTSK